MSENRHHLPSGWANTHLEDIGMTGTQTVDPAKFPDTIFELWSVPSFPSGKPEFPTGKEIGSTKQSLETGDVLLCKINPRINRVWYVDPNTNHPQIGSSEWIIFRTSHIDPSFLMYRLREEGFRKELCSNVSGVGGSLTRARPQIVKKIEITIPPLNEQRRIVTKIEILQERSHRARQALDAIPPLLEKFRQSVMASAFRGDLTADWRKQHPDDEPASVLLERIRTERRQRWEEAESAKMEAKGKEPKDDKWKAKYKEPEPVDVSGLPELPKGWAWACLEQLVLDISYGHTASAQDQPIGPKLLRITDIQDDSVNWQNVPYCECGKVDTYKLHAGDIVVARTGATTGKSFLVLDPPDMAVFASYLIRLKTTNTFSARFLSLFMQSPNYWHQITTVSKGTAQPGANATILSRLTVPVPPLLELNQLTQRISEALAPIRDMRDSLISTVNRVESLNQSILAKAFRGELVPQNPSDEPASALLEQIRKEREAQISKGKKKRSAPKRTAQIMPKPTSAETKPIESPPTPATTVDESEDEAEPAPDTHAPATNPLPIESYSTEEVMTAIRQVLRGKSGLSREELLYQLASGYGFTRVGPKTKKVLSGHLLAAQRRHILTSDGLFLFLEGASISDYTRDELVDTIISVTNMQCIYSREELIYEVSTHLGFSRVTDSTRDQMKSAINAALRRGILERHDSDKVKRVG
jgi:type I restriction enzyme, S subunit